MAPRRLSDFKVGGLITFGMGNLHERPRHAILILQIIVQYAQIEGMMSHVLAVMLGAKIKPAMAIYMALYNSSAQRDAIKAVAKSTLQEDKLDLFTVLVGQVTSLGNIRNDFAHGNWGIASQISDGILWRDPDVDLENDMKSAEHGHAMDEWFASGMSGDKPIDPDDSRSLDQDTLVYSHADLAEICSQVLTLNDRILSLSFALNPRHPARDKALERLMNEPDIQKAVDQARHARQSSQAKQK